MANRAIGYKDANGNYGFVMYASGSIKIGNDGTDVIAMTGSTEVLGRIKAIPPTAYNTNTTLYRESFEGLTADQVSPGNPATNGTWTNGAGTKTGGQIANAYEWQSRTSGTPSGNTGPTAAHSGSNYVFTEASANQSANNDGSNVFYAMQRSFTATEASEIGKLSFYYHMHGADMGSLWVSASTDGSSWTGLTITKDADGSPSAAALITGEQQANQGDDWKRAEVDLTPYMSSVFYIKFLGYTLAGYRGDIAIDAIEFMPAPYALYSTAPVSASTYYGSGNGLEFDDAYIDVIRRKSDSSTTTKIRLQDEVVKIHAGSANDEVLKLESGTATLDGDLVLNQYIKHNGDADTLINFTDDKIVLKAGNKAMVTMEEKGSAPHEVTINDGSNNIDFVVKGNGSNEGNPLFMCDASTGRVGINGVGSPSYELDVDGTIAATTLDIAGDADIDGTLEADAITVDGTALNEYIADTVGAMVGSNTESGISVAYQDSDNTLDFTVSGLSDSALASDCVTAAKIATAVAGDGLAGGGGAALSVNVDDTTIDISGDNLRIKPTGNVSMNSLTASSDGIRTGKLQVNTNTRGGNEMVRILGSGDNFNTVVVWGADTTTEYVSLGVNSSGVPVVAGGYSGDQGASDLGFATQAGSGTDEAVKMTLKSDGKLGLGTTGPDTSLHVKGSESGAAVGLKIENTSNSAEAMSQIHFRANTMDTYLRMYEDSSTGGARFDVNLGGTQDFGTMRILTTDLGNSWKTSLENDDTQLGIVGEDTEVAIVGKKLETNTCMLSLKEVDTDNTTYTDGWAMMRTTSANDSILKFNYGTDNNLWDGTTKASLETDGSLTTYGASGPHIIAVRDDASTGLGDELGKIGFDSNDGGVGNLGKYSAYMMGVASETYSSTAKGARLEFYTKANGTDFDALATKRMVIHQTGVVQVGIDTVDDRGVLQVKQTGDDEIGGGLTIIQSGTDDEWTLWQSTAENLNFSFNGSSKGYLNDGANVSNITFTGQHRCSPSSGSSFVELSSSVGKIVVSDGTYSNLQESGVSINESIPRVKLSDSRNQKSAFGIVSDAEDENRGTREYSSGIYTTIMDKSDSSDNRLYINSLGEGAVWITNINGNIENGDYITTCEIPGYGMKQDDDLLHNYTVAKITQDCDFDLNSSTYECTEITHEGITYRAAFVGCTYHCG